MKKCILYEYHETIPEALSACHHQNPDQYFCLSMDRHDRRYARLYYVRNNQVHQHRFQWNITHYGTLDDLVGTLLVMHHVISMEALPAFKDNIEKHHATLPMTFLSSNIHALLFHKTTQEKENIPPKNHQDRFIVLP